MIGIDIETWCELDIKKVGAPRYLENAEILCLAEVHYTDLCDAVYSAETQDYLDYVREHAEDFVYDNLRNPGCVQKRFESYDATAGDTAPRIVAHNAFFEQYAMCLQLAKANPRKLTEPYVFFEDSMTAALVDGYSGGLNQAARQLFGVTKLEVGKSLMKLFSMPHKDFDFKVPTWERIVALGYEDKWNEYLSYCAVDAALSVLIYNMTEPSIPIDPLHVTMRMNLRGFPVDSNALAYYKASRDHSITETLLTFREEHPDLDELNFNSPKQIADALKNLGLRVSSTDEQALTKLAHQIEEHTKIPEETKRTALDIIQTRLLLANTSLSKIDKLDNLKSADSRLRDSYVLAGAPQTHRTSGRGVQLQNLPRLPETLLDMNDADLDARARRISNASAQELASNLRQLFRAAPGNTLLVSDYSSVEARMLAFVAGQEDVVEAFAHNLDLYKVLASKMYGVPYADVTPSQRKAGKVGVLACGYGAGAGAVKSFAEKMGIHFSSAEVAQLVKDWREANPMVVSMWSALDAGLHEVARKPAYTWVNVDLSNHFSVGLVKLPEDDSLTDLHPGCTSLRISIRYKGLPIGFRTLRGFYKDAKGFVYHRPTSTKNGPLWTDEFTSPKTKQREKFRIYGGKLTGHLIQSICRIQFFRGLEEVECTFPGRLIGQFHDEIIMEVPMAGIEATMDKVTEVFTRTIFDGFPLAAETKHAPQYIK